MCHHLDHTMASRSHKRRSWLASRWLTLLALKASLAIEEEPTTTFSTSSSCTWCGFRNGPQHTGVAPPGPKIGASAGDPPPVAWSASLNHSSASSLAFGADGTLFVGGGNVPTSKLPYYGAGLYALDGATGAAKWFFPTNDSVSGGPAISADGGSVYIGNDDSEQYRKLLRIRGGLSLTKLIEKSIRHPPPSQILTRCVVSRSMLLTLPVFLK